MNVTVVDTPGFKDTDDAAFVDEIMSVLGKYIVYILLSVCLHFFIVSSQQRARKFKKVHFCNFKNGQKSIFYWGKSLKLPKMQFHEKNFF